MDNQRATSSTTFQPQQTAQPAIETLLFNDIIEEKSLILRDIMDQFLQVHPFSKFETEFNLFTRRLKHIARDGQRNGTNITRNTMQMPSDNVAQPKPSEHSESQENDPQHAEPTNTFQRPMTQDYKHRTTLPYTDQSSNIPFNTTNNLCDTIIEESSISNDTTQKNAQQLEFLPLSVPIPYSGSSQIDNASLSTGNGNDDNAMESDSKLVESAKSPTNSDNTSISQLNQFKRIENTKAKYLTKWSVNTKEIKSNKGNSKVITLTGTLLAGDQITVLKKVHKAGILMVRKTKNIVKTDNGLYHLIGPIIEGSPHNLYRACVEINGIPKTWRNILTHLSTDVKKHLNKSMTRKGTIYNKEKVGSRNSSGEKALFESELLNDSDFRQQLTQISTSRTMKSFEGCHTPSQLLKYKFHRKYVKACLIISSQDNNDDQ